MSDSDICSDDSMYGGFGAIIANDLHRGEEKRACCWEEERAARARHAVAAASAAPAPAEETVSAARTPGANKPPPLAVTECTYLTKRPYKRKKKAAEPAAAPAPATAPAPAPLVAVDGAAAHAPAEKKPPPSILPHPMRRPCPFCSTSPSIQAIFLSRS